MNLKIEQTDILRKYYKMNEELRRLLFITELEQRCFSLLMNNETPLHPFIREHQTATIN